MWWLAISASIGLNLFLFFYIRWLLRALAVVNQDVESVGEILQDYSSHINSIYELEMYYGDETMKSLIKHTKELTDTISNLDLVLNEEQKEEEGKYDQAPPPTKN
jgi:hypothetical protein